MERGGGGGLMVAIAVHLFKVHNGDSLWLSYDMPAASWNLVDILMHRNVNVSNEMHLIS